MNVPKLRFQEYSGEWQEKLISDCFFKINERNKNKSIDNVISNTAKYGLVKQEEYFDKDIAVQENTENYFVINKGDFVYNPRKSTEAPYGPIRLYQLEETGIVSPLYLCFRSKNTLFDSFYNYFFQSSKWYRYVHKNGDSGARADRVNIKDKVFFSLNTFLPIIDEQEKMVDFLNVVYEKIDNQKAIVESLEKQKKALMQKIFSQELRFKDDDGKEFPAWEEKKLGEVAKIYDGTHQTPNYVDCGIRFVSVEDIKSLYNSNKFITVDEFESNFKVHPQKGDVLMTRIGDIGTATFVDGDEPLAYYVSLALMKPFGILGMFLLQYIRSNTFQHELWRRTLHIAFPKKINKNEIGECLVMVPCIKEQEKIAELLSSYDEKIETEKKSLEKWIQIKKGLLQQMFV